jgi:hypothetical protein
MAGRSLRCMERRQFLAASIATSALAAAGQGQAASSREFYQMRRYAPASGPADKAHGELLWRCADSGAGKRMGMGPVGAFRVDIGPETPVYYLLIPGSRVRAGALAELDLRLVPRMRPFLKAADPFWNATAAAPGLPAGGEFAACGISRLAEADAAGSALPRASASFNCAPMRAPATATTCARWRCFTPANSKSS